MKETKVTSSKDRAFVKAEDWNSWLGTNHNKYPGVWIIFPKKKTGITTLSYEEALDIGLAYGWIDVSIRRIDDRTFGRKFTPRRLESVWTRSNVERARKLIKEGKMTKWGLEAFQKRLNKPKAVKKKTAKNSG
jgi:uncharacterized protein YdeI (YjbR/CyaY-like superfamily)